jgi:3-dehydroquinate synthase
VKTITLTPPAPSTAYDIVVGSGILNNLSKIIEKTGSVDNVIVLHDEALRDVAEGIASSVDGHLISVASGEASKSMTEVERITNEMLEVKATRQSLLINVGGGMITDLGGFVASLYMRGISCIHIPTSLLSMVDASIGGKTGVDIGTTKNILGRFNHPHAVIADIDLLQSLPDDQMRDGLTEVIKIAAMRDASFFSELEEDVQKILDRDAKALTNCIAHAIQLKADVVEQDEKEADLRMQLNFGHTVGHALETLSEFSISHGKAVSIGMVEEMRLTGAEGSERVLELLQKIEMPVEMPKEYKREDLWTVMQSDKKVSQGDVRIAVPKSIGEGCVQILKHDVFLAGS